MEQRKKRILYWSDGAGALTGFGQTTLRLLKSWQKTGKYEILNLCGCVQDGDPNFQRFPWKCRGTIPQNPNIIQRMNQDQGYGRAVSYGLEMIEPMVLDFKPDIVMCVQDPWGSSDIAVQKYFWNKTNCISWETLDSIPLHQPNVDNASKLKNHYCWSTFAEKEFHRLGHKHVKTQFPPVDTNIYTPLLPEQKNQLKKYFKIEDKKFIINYVFRSQLRKQSWGIIEAYSILQKQNPEIAKDVWLHFHTNTKEGWNHKKFCDQYEVDYNRILYTWICKNCRELQVKSDNGDCNCPHCNSQNSQETCSVSFGATPEQMNWVYNIGNCSTVVANSGATELPCIEALASGLPLATVSYSYGEDFCAQPFVFTIDSTKCVEFPTQFIKVMPVAQSIVKFIRKIYRSSTKEIQEISESGRKWVKDNFDTEVVSRKWQEVFDNMPEVTWDFTIKSDIKDPNAQIQNIEDDLLFVQHCYSEILNMKDMTPEKNETQHWVNFIKQPGDKNKWRQEMVNSMRNIAAQKNAEQKQVTLEDLLIKNNKKQFLIVCPESAGDIFYVSSTLESFRKSYPKEEWNLYFACKKEFMELLDLNPNIDRVLEYHPMMESEINMTGMGGNPGIFQGYAHATILSQRQLSYLTNNNLSLNIKQ